ncbi:type II toxin-antitoxin system HicB family antitoxin [Candidatus Woesearchaeota archaeon]|nr:type II toxin-antitoxin system HicB family antitoxin [Candidatus Woesearchaeota archaeon]
MTKKFTVLIEQDEEGIYVGKVPELKGCISQGDTIDELVNNIKEAIELCLEVNKEKDVSFDNLKFIGIQQVEVAS